MRKALSLVCSLLLILSAGAGASALAAPAFSPEMVALSERLDTYEIEAVFDPGEGTLECVQRVRYHNRTGQDLTELVFHAYANAFQSADTTPIISSAGARVDFSPGGILFSQVLIDGQAADPEPTLQGEDLTLLVIETPVAADQRLEIELRYKIYLPEYPYRFGMWEGQFAFGNAFPILAVFEEGDFRADGYAPVGDPFYSECANYMLYLTVPPDCAVATTGALRAETAQEGTRQLTYEALAVRDYALFITQRQVVEERLVDGVLLMSYAQTRQQAQAALEIAEQCFAYYQGLLGETYPYPVLTVVQADLGVLGGMEYPALAAVNSSMYQRGKESDLFLVIAHEIAHQWWYGQVGSDQILAPWLDEGLTEYTALMAVQALQGEAAFQHYIEGEIEASQRIDLPAGVVMSSPLWNFSTWTAYDRVVYKRAAGMIHGLRLALGDEAFAGVLNTYLMQNRFAIADREALAAAIQTVTGENWRGYLDDYLDSRD